MPVLMWLLAGCSKDPTAADGPATDDCAVVSYWEDADGDGFGAGDPTWVRCTWEVAPEDAVMVGGDCDDTAPWRFPGNVEDCDEEDNDCDGEVDEGFANLIGPLDDDTVLDASAPWCVRTGLIVEVGQTLIIEPGATVVGESPIPGGWTFPVEVHGTVEARGTREDPIAISKLDFFGRSNSHQVFEHVTMVWGTIWGGVIRDSVLQGVGVGLGRDGMMERTIVLPYSPLRHTTTRVVSIEGSTLRNNVFVSDATGSTVEVSFSSEFESTIKGNSFVGFGVGLIYRRPEIVRLKQGTAYAFDPYDVSENYWGSTNPSFIETKILDRNDDPRLGTVTFEPVLSEPHPDTPDPADIVEEP